MQNSDTLRAQAIEAAARAKEEEERMRKQEQEEEAKAAAEALARMRARKAAKEEAARAKAQEEAERAARQKEEEAVRTQDEARVQEAARAMADADARAAEAAKARAEEQARAQEEEARAQQEEARLLQEEARAAEIARAQEKARQGQEASALEAAAQADAKANTERAALPPRGEGMGGGVTPASANNQLGVPPAPKLRSMGGTQIVDLSKKDLDPTVRALMGEEKFFGTAGRSVSLTISFVFRGVLLCDALLVPCARAIYTSFYQTSFCHVEICPPPPTSSVGVPIYIMQRGQGAHRREAV